MGKKEFIVFFTNLQNALHSPRQFFIIFTIMDSFSIFIIGCVGINNKRLEKIGGIGEWVFA